MASFLSSIPNYLWANIFSPKQKTTNIYFCIDSSDQIDDGKKWRKELDLYLLAGFLMEMFFCFGKGSRVQDTKLWQKI